jgi:hypothetical protein
MPSPSRRQFLISLVAITAPSYSHAASMVQESDPLARTLAYVSDTTRANQVDYPSHTTDQMCRICTSFQGNPKEGSGPCKVYSGRIVSTKGWCSAFERRPGT